MLMYECLSLNHPFSRNKRDHARELILHGWRPSLTEQVKIQKCPDYGGWDGFNAVPSPLIFSISGYA